MTGNAHIQSISMLTIAKKLVFFHLEFYVLILLGYEVSLEILK